MDASKGTAQHIAIVIMGKRGNYKVNAKSVSGVLLQLLPRYRWNALDQKLGSSRLLDCAACGRDFLECHDSPLDNCTRFS